MHAERLAEHILHRVEEPVFVSADVVDRHHVGMIPLTQTIRRFPEREPNRCTRFEA
jgi:hypothetical protein